MLRAGSTAAIRAPASGCVTPSDIVGPAHAEEAARFTAEHIVGGRRKLTALDRVNGVREPLLGVRNDIATGRLSSEQRHNATRAFEGNVHRLAKLPRTIAAAREPLL